MATQPVNCDFDFGGSSKALNLPPPSTPAEPARFGDVVPATFASNTVAWDSTITLDFSTINATVRTLALAGATSFVASGLSHGRSARILIAGDTVDRSLAFPAAWKWFGAPKPTALAAGKEAMLYLEVIGGSTDASVKAIWSLQS